jgi:hypothetical protein
MISAFTFTSILRKGTARVGAQPVHEGPHGRVRAREEEVDAFAGQQHGALEALRRRLREHLLTQRMGIVDRDELVGGDVEDGGHLRDFTGGPAS